MSQQSPPGVDDGALVVRARAGDRLAFEELVRLYADRLHAVVRRLVDNEHEAEEVTQEAFLRAWRGIAKVKGDSQFFTWLYRIGVNRGAPSDVSPPPRAGRPAPCARTGGAGAEA